ncbi:hypothetical protein C0W88_02900 [Photobacterium leiognathi subsp. mandapamensis]|uniref:PepSY domain-containing protein n=1 Tax=Photobacterium leiognathi TaxID=553611 RepID=UPI000D16E1A2|nr:hypothetical protein [Photobacterium leiognathi]PSW67132.1 hypothetical protein C0W88_02900 [Photobacterium leiognathi subsp. mandapamensis]
MKIRHRYLYIIGLIGTLTFAAIAAPSVDDDEHHDDVMTAVEKGLIKPYSALQHKVSRQLSARIIKVELNEDNGEWIYELKLIDNENNIIKVEYQAQSLQMLQIKGRHLENVIKAPK